MDFQTLINSRLGVALGLGLGRALPPDIGYRLADAIARLIAARHDLPMVRAMRANQWVVAGETLSAAELDQAVEDTFRHTARCLYDLYHHLNDLPALENRIVFSPPIERLIERLKQGREGTVVVALHLSNFDLVGRAAALRGWRSLVLSYPQPGGGYRWQNAMRQQFGSTILPASPTALRTALRHLRAGGNVATGIDRPFPQSKHQLLFFGRPARLGTAPVYLALKAQVPVAVTAAVMDPDGRYRILGSDLIPMQPHPDREQAIILNAERLLRVAEDFIRQYPHQWAMFYPVWPEALHATP